MYIFYLEPVVCYASVTSGHHNGIKILTSTIFEFNNIVVNFLDSRKNLLVYHEEHHWKIIILFYIIKWDMTPCMYKVFSYLIMIPYLNLPWANFADSSTIDYRSLSSKCFEKERPISRSMNSKVWQVTVAEFAEK